MVSPLVNTIEVKLSVGQSQSEIVDLNGNTIFGLYAPQNLTGFPSTLQTRFIASPNGNADNIAPIRERTTGLDIGAVIVAAPPGYNYTYVELPGSKFAGVRYFGIVAEYEQADTDAIFLLAVRPA